jgi:hypothetical protein
MPFHREPLESKDKLDILLTEWANNHEKTASSHGVTTPFSIHPAFIFFLQPVRAALLACRTSAVF